MAKKKATNNATLKNTFSAIKKQANSLNNEVLTATEELVDGSVDTVQQWQNLTEKLLKGGTELLERQQEFSIDVLENVVKQTKSGGNRAKELVNFNFDFKNIWEKNKDKVSVKNMVSNFRKNADELVVDVVKKGKKVATKAKKATDEMVKEATSKTKKTTAKAKKTAKRTAKKTAAK